MITPSQLLQIITVSFARAQTLADLLNRICPLYGINTPKRLAAFIAQCAHESQSFARKEENLNYREDRLLVVFPKYFTKTTAGQAVGNPQRIANTVYGGRMGNEPYATGDGFRYRGGGFIQITGRDMYLKYAAYKKVDINTVADLVRTSDEWAMDSACWLFAIEKKLLDEADAGDTLKITRAINGGINGLPERMALYKKATIAFGIKV